MYVFITAFLQSMRRISSGGLLVPVGSFVFTHVSLFYYIMFCKSLFVFLVTIVLPDLS